MRRREYGEQGRRVERAIVLVVLFILPARPIVFHVLVNLFKLRCMFVFTVPDPWHASCTPTAGRSKPWSSVAGRREGKGALINNLLAPCFWKEQGG